MDTDTAASGECSRERERVDEASRSLTLAATSAFPATFQFNPLNPPYRSQTLHPRMHTNDHDWRHPIIRAAFCTFALNPIRGLVSGRSTVFHYRAFGLNIASELDLPELQTRPEASEPDVHIRVGAVPESLADPQESGVLFQAAPNRFLLRLDHVRFLVQNGSEILVERLAENAAQLRVFLLGSCFGALLHQRGLLVLHASAVQTPKGAVAFAGVSGAGKSTTLGAFLQRGYPLLSDDLAAIHRDETGRLVVEPAIPRARLWSDSASQLGHSTRVLRREQPELEKYLLPASSFASSPVPLHRVYLLHTDNLAKVVSLESLAPFQAFKALVQHTFRQRFLNGLGTRFVHFGLVSAAVSQAPIVKLTRPSKPFLLDELADRLEADFLA
jgi:hypothetical protein